MEGVLESDASDEESADLPRRHRKTVKISLAGFDEWFWEWCRNCWTQINVTHQTSNPTLTPTISRQKKSIAVCPRRNQIAPEDQDLGQVHPWSGQERAYLLMWTKTMRLDIILELNSIMRLLFARGGKEASSSCDNISTKRFPSTGLLVACNLEAQATVRLKTEHAQHANK